MDKEFVQTKPIKPEGLVHVWFNIRLHSPNGWLRKKAFTQWARKYSRSSLLCNGSTCLIIPLDTKIGTENIEMEKLVEQQIQGCHW